MEKNENDVPYKCLFGMHIVGKHQISYACFVSILSANLFR